MRRSVLATALAAVLATGIVAHADQPTPPPPPVDEGSGSAGSGSATRPDERDHDKDLDHDNATGRSEPRKSTGDGNPSTDPTDHPIYAPRLHGSNKDIVVETPGERSSKNIAVLTSIASASVITGLFGLYFHLGGKSAADDVSQSSFMGRTWSDHYQSDVDKAAKDRKLAIGFYSAGGALLVAAIIGLIATDPTSTTTIIHPHSAMVAPVPGGAVFAKGWTF